MRRRRSSCLNLLCRIGVSGGEFVKEEERREEILRRRRRLTATNQRNTDGWNRNPAASEQRNLIE